MVTLTMLGIGGCRRHRMTAADCGVVLDRIVQLELAERGFRDPALARRRQGEIRARLSTELAACEGRRARSDVMTCLRGARSAEEISHGCLR
jgi:hypothetical protein